jgi:hypothetical protein
VVLVVAEILVQLEILAEAMAQQILAVAVALALVVVQVATVAVMVALEL